MRSVHYDLGNMKKKIIYNISASLILEIVTVVCAFILPRMILSGFGSEYNGIVSSVSQFLSIVTLLRGGVGGVTRAALYRPLVENDINKISAIINATERFMRRIAYIFVVFLLIFAAGYPLLVAEEFDWFYTFTLVLILGISTIAQYYFGITYQFLLSADQKSYIYSVMQTVATILNTVFSVMLINAGVEFRLMKLISALVFAAIPLALYWYVHKHYTIIRTIPADDSCIKQRWDAFVHQVAAFIHSNTDLMLLTVFSNLYQVSVYSIYNMVVTGVKKFVTVFTSGMESVIGKMIANDDNEQLNSFVEMYEWIINVISVVAFGCTAVLLVPFVKVYTLNITDAEYIQPALGYWLVAAAFISCIRLPYQNVVESAGHFKETRNGAVVEALINVVTSIVLVGFFGAVGVAAGTTFAMAFRTVQYAAYSSRKILKRSCVAILKRAVTTGVNIILFMVPYFLFELDVTMLRCTSGFFSWILLALVAFIVIVCISILLNAIVYRSVFRSVLRFWGSRKVV